jgi:hypothetical protein
VQVGQILIVRKAMPCRREARRLHATIPDGQRITVLESAPDSGKVRFSAVCEGEQETFVAVLLIVERCCTPAGVKPE